MVTIPKIPSSEITPLGVYLSRRDFIRGLGLAAGSMALAACGIGAPAPAASSGSPAPSAGAVSKTTDELGQALTPYDAITNYNNYYEFDVDKQTVAGLAKNFVSSPWEVKVGGLVKNPKTYSIDDLLKLGVEERIYRLRCVEAWSMVIPWQGFPMSKLLAQVEPTSDAKYVRFETLYAPDKFPGQNDGWYSWPYVEGLRLDEAMNDLAIFATGLYGKPLPPQDGAPIRVVVPWKYGFKSIKAIVKIDLVDKQPTSLWMNAAPNEYGFYANVNPEVDHPRWSQASERRIGEIARRPTLKFNGYEAQVAHLYDGMDLRANF